MKISVLRPARLTPQLRPGRAGDSAAARREGKQAEPRRSRTSQELLRWASASLGAKKGGNATRHKPAQDSEGPSGPPSPPELLQEAGLEERPARGPAANRRRRHGSRPRDIGLPGMAR